MRRIFHGMLLALLVVALQAYGAAPPRGADRLRELVVFPELNLTFNFGMRFNGARWIITDRSDIPADIVRLRGEVKQRTDDISRLLQLGYLLSTDGQTNESRACYQRAATLCEQRAAANARDGLNLTHYGQALTAMGQDKKAEVYFRRAVLVASNDWQCWAGLGDFLRQQFGVVLFQDLTNKTESATILTMPAKVNFHPGVANMKAAQALEVEAGKCFDQAVSLAPKEPEAYLQRGGFQGMAYGQNSLLRYYQYHEPFDTNVWVTGFMSPGLLTNLQMAAELSPRSPEFLGAAAYLVWSRALSQLHHQYSGPGDLPDDVLQYTRGAMSRLEDLTVDPDKLVAASAEKNLGVLHMMMGDMPDAVMEVKRSVALDPSQDDAWDLVLAFQVGTATPEELAAICESRLKYKDSARNHLLFARALQRQQKWNAAADQAKAALTVEPDNVVAEAELLALALKQSTDPEQLKIAGIIMPDLTQKVGNMPPGIEAAKRRREVLLDLAIAGGLINTPDAEKIARTCLALVLKDNPDDQAAKDILSALE